MTREELRKKRQEIAKNNGYSEYKSTHANQQPVTSKETSESTVMPRVTTNQMPVTSSVSTWDKVQARTVKNQAIGNKTLSDTRLATNQTNLKVNAVQPVQSVSKREAKKEEKKGKKLLADIEYEQNKTKKEQEYQNELKRADTIGGKIATGVSNAVGTLLQKPRALYDGVQLSDALTIPASTALGATAHVIEGVKSVADAGVNAGAYGVASIADIAGAKDFSKRLVKAIQSNTEEQKQATDKVNSIFDKNSILGKTGNQAFESTGQSSVFGGLASGGMGKTANALTFGMGASGGFEEAYQQENTKGWEALLKGAGSGTASYISENLFDWMGYGGNKLTKGLKDKIAQQFSTGLASGLSRLGFSALGEGAEEIAEEVLNKKVINNLVNTIIKENKYNTDIDIAETVAGAVTAMFSVLGSGAGPTIINSQYETQNNKKLEQIQNSDLEDFEKETLSQIAEQYNLSDEDVKKAIQNTKDGKYNNLEQIESTTTQNNEVLNGEQQTIQDENKMAQNELSTQPSEYTTNLMKSIDNYNNSRQEGQEIFDINNEETRKEIESIQKVAENRGINITFDESRFDNTDTNAFYEYDEKGNVANIVLNPNSTSKKYVQNLVIHEMTHSFEGSKEYNNLSKAILDYAKKTGEYDKAFKDLKNTYSSVYKGDNIDSIVEKEAVANILGEKLGDKEFVDSLVNNQYVERSTIQKIIDFAKNQINRFKGYKDQEQYWNNIKTLYEEAYNKSKVSKEGLKQSVETTRNNKIDTEFSTDTTGAWNNFIEKYFKNEGEGTAIKDLKKLPTREYTIQDYEEVINNSANIPEADKTAILKDLEGIELNKQSLNDFKQYVEDLDNNYKEVAQEREQQRFENKNYKDEGRAELISNKRKEFNTNMEYDDSVVAELDEIIPRNRNGKRTVAEWKNMAKQLGQRIANLSPEQIEDIAVKSYYDLEPTKAITRYDNRSKTNVGYEQLYANDWVNEVYEGVRENRQFSMETENQENKPTQKELPKAETQLPTRDTSLEEDIEAFRQETRKVTDKTKGRKHLETYATSESVGKEGRKVARELYNSEQYVPISNRETMTKANTKIQTGGVENTYTELTNRFKTNEKMTLQDIATGERLIQIYSAQGDYAKVNELMQDVAILGTELGQQVQALSIIKKASPEGQLQLLNRLVERTNNKQNTDIQITDEQAEKILKSKNKEELDNNVSEVTLELAQQLPITMKDKIRSWRYLSMLGNPRTHIRNIVGNVAMNVLQNTKNKVAGAGEDIASIFNKNFERTKTFKGATKEQKAYAKADSYIMENVLENGGKYSAETLLDQNKRQFDNKILNKIADINSSLLEKEDTIFLRTAYRQALQGYMSANKITAQEMENNPKVANKARQYAIEQAQEATFHQFNALASTLNQIEEKGGVAGTLTSAILPFKKTPLNIAKTGIEYSPINIMRAVGGTISDITQTNKDLQSQLNKGKITQEEYNSEISSIVNNRIDQMAKGLTGTALGILGYALSKMGVLKATNKDDEDEFEESLGKQEFSIQIGDNTYSLDWLAPTAIPLFIGANIQELFNETGKELNEEGEEKTFYDRVGDTLNTTVTGLTQAFEPMTEMSMLQGLASALSSYEQDSSNKIFDIGASALQSYAGQFVPTALGQVAKTIDPVVRDTSSTKKGFAKKVDQLKRQTTAKIPFASKTLPSKSDVWGEEKTRADNILQRFVETAVLPYNREKVIDDMTSEQLKDVFRETGESGALPKNPQKYFTVNKQKYNLTSEEYNNAKKIYGKTAKSILDDVTKTQQYKDLDKDIKVKLLKDIYSYAKEEIKVDYSNKKKLDYEPKVNNSANKYKIIQTYKQNKNIEELLKLYNKD